MTYNLFSLIIGALTQNPAAFQAVTASLRGFTQALMVLLLGGISLGVGQNVVLFANRIPRRRFFSSLLAGASFLLGTVILWAGVIWMLSQLNNAFTLSLWQVLAIVCLSTVPLLFGFLVLIPYLGNPINHQNPP